MLTSGTVSTCNTVNLRSLLIEHLEDHERKEVQVKRNESSWKAEGLLEVAERLTAENKSLYAKITELKKENARLEALQKLGQQAAEQKPFVAVMDGRTIMYAPLQLITP